MTTAGEVVAATVSAFDEALHKARFEQMGTPHARLGGWEWVGFVSAPGGHQRVAITLSEGFPFAPPRVRLQDVDGAESSSWHLETDGTLCLWGAEERGALPWLDAARLIDKIETWLRRDAEGWTDDDPALDLEAYYEPDPLAATVIFDADEVTERLLLFRLTRDRVLNVERRAFTPQKLRKRLRDRGTAIEGIAVDIGEVHSPRLAWVDLRRHLDPGRWSAVDQALQAKRSMIVVVRYTRGGHTGLMALTARREAGDVTLRSLTLADTGESTRALRSGPDRSALQRKRVAIVGVGAVGSFLADQLARSGIGELLLLDNDILRPGNCIRHLCAPDEVGLPKTAAVRRHIAGRQLPGTVVVTEGPRLATLADAVDLTSSYDLVVDATADDSIQRMLAEACRILQYARFLSVALEGHGQFARADVIPPPDCATTLGRGGVADVNSDLREGGCGDPVSPTPPAAVVEAASIGARQAVALLLGKETGAGERRHLGWHT